MLTRIMPYIGLGLFIVLLVFAVIFLSYLFIFGAIVGLILFSIAWVRAKFAKKKPTTATTQTHHGKIYDHDEIK